MADQNVARLTKDALYLCVALMLSFVETLLPALPFPGVKLGLANLAILLCTLTIGFSDAVAVALARWLLTGLLFGSGTSLLFALSGTICMLATLFLLLHLPLTKYLSCIGISLLTATAHNLGQLLCAAFLYGWGIGLLRVYGGSLLLIGALCGTVTGTVCNVLLSRIEKNHH